MGKPNPQNLKPYKPGQSGNPKGRPPWKPIEDIFKEFLGQTHTDSKGVTKSRLEWLNARVFADAMNGKAQAQQLVYERTYGKAKQPIVGGEDGDNAIKVAVEVKFGK